MANTKDIGSAFDLLGKSKDIVVANWQVFIWAYLPFILLTVMTTLDAPRIESEPMPFDFTLVNSIVFGILPLVIILVIIYFAAAVTVLEVRAARGENPIPRLIFAEALKFFVRFIALGFVGGLIILLGLLLLIVPGVIAIGRLAMSPYHMIDKNLGPIEALKASNNQAKGNMGKIYAAIVVMILIQVAASIVGILPFIGGLISLGVTIIFSLVLVLRYQQLKTLKAS